MNATGHLLLIVVGVLVALWILWELWLRTRKKCPDCAKGIEKAARVCPHCGYRFSPSFEEGQR